MIMQHWSIFGTALSPPEPERVLEAVRRVGFPEARIAEVKKSLCSTDLALHYAPSRAPLFVTLEELIPDERDVNTGTWEMAEERISDPAALRSLRCYAGVRHYENVDPAAVKAVVEFLRAECDEVGLFPLEMH
jgi:hypothetical protein